MHGAVTITDHTILGAIDSLLIPQLSTATNALDGLVYTNEHNDREAMKAWSKAGYDLVTLGIASKLKLAKEALEGTGKLGGSAAEVAKAQVGRLEAVERAAKWAGSGLGIARTLTPSESGELIILDRVRIFNTEYQFGAVGPPPGWLLDGEGSGEHAPAIQPEQLLRYRQEPVHGEALSTP